MTLVGFMFANPRLGIITHGVSMPSKPRNNATAMADDALHAPIDQSFQFQLEASVPCVESPKHDAGPCQAICKGHDRSCKKADLQVHPDQARNLRQERTEPSRPCQYRNDHELDLTIHQMKIYSRRHYSRRCQMILDAKAVRTDKLLWRNGGKVL